MERRFPWPASQLPATAFSPVVTEFAEERAIQSQATTFSFAAADFGLHLGGLSEGWAEPMSPSH